ncbi:MAG: glycosyltransferase, partial [Candidatus Baldrarchaeia archaeon]
GSTLLFEGGFSAYKKKVLESFDPYNTGSDDCGTVIRLLEKGYKAILVPEARFYSPFPASWIEKLRIKLRRANQLVRVLWRYFSLIFRGCLKSSKRVVVQGILAYLFGPIIFIGLLAVTAFLLSCFPYFALIFLVFFIPKVRFYLLEIIQNYLLLFISILAAVFGKKFIVWRKPKNRILLQEYTLRQHGLI